MTAVFPFRQRRANSTVVISAGAASSNKRIFSATDANRMSTTARVCNRSTADNVYIDFGDDDTVAATVATSMCIPPSTVEPFTLAGDYAAAITDGNTVDVEFTIGGGV